jgi:NitT/TauT family transport system substrate-binding protein
MRRQATVFAILAYALLALGGMAADAQTKLTKTTLGLGTAAVVYIGPYVAQAAGLFKEEGLDVELIHLGSGPPLTAALVGGSVDMILPTSEQVVRASSQGLPLVALANVFGVYTNAVALSNAAIEKAGITTSMSVDEKVQRMRGLRLAISAPGSSTDQFIRTLFLARKLDPDREITIQPFGEGGAMLAALEHGVVDGLVTSPPWPDLVAGKKLGKIVVDPVTGEVPEYRDFPFITLAVLSQNIAEKQAQSRSVMRALAKACRLIRERPDEARELARGYFKSMDESLFRITFDKLRSGVPEKLAISAEQLDAVARTSSMASKQPIAADYAAMVSSETAGEVDRQDLCSRQ